MKLTYMPGSSRSDTSALSVCPGHNFGLGSCRADSFDLCRARSWRMQSLGRRPVSPQKRAVIPTELHVTDARKGVRADVAT